MIDGLTKLPALLLVEGTIGKVVRLLVRGVVVRVLVRGVVKRLFVRGVVVTVLATRVGL